MMNDAEVLHRVGCYVKENFLYTRPDAVIGEDESLLGNGVMDSMGVMELIAYLEEEFGIDVNDDEVTEANLGTLRAVTEFVGTKRSAADVAA